MVLSTYKLVLTSLNLTGSLLSSVAAAFILLCYIVIPPKRHIRHLLIINLAIADFVNAVNLSISGIIVLANQSGLSPGVPCIINGFIAQLTVSGTDWSIFAIAVITLIAIRSARWKSLPEARKWRYTFFVCAAVWVIPLTTTLIATTLDLLGPVSGSWCWLKSDPVYVRYVMTHGWRLTFMAAEIAMYSYLYWYIRREFNNLPARTTAFGRRESSLTGLPSRNEGHETVSSQNMPLPFILRKQSHSSESLNTPSAMTRTPAPSELPNQSTAFDADSVSRLLLLNAYPLAYIILWIPGVANRFAEAAGRPSKVLEMMQATTQFVGFANALTYGWNEKVADSLKAWWRNKA